MVMPNMPHTITYWAPSTGSNRYGKPTSVAPIQIKGRWEGEMQTVQSKKGEEIVSKTTVYLNQDVSIDGYLLLGASNATDPSTLDDAYEIQAKSTTPDLRGMQSLTTVYL